VYSSTLYTSINFLDVKLCPNSPVTFFEFEEFKFEAHSLKPSYCKKLVHIRADLTILGQL
jgi:hypothetical protein